LFQVVESDDSSDFNVVYRLAESDTFTCNVALTSTATRTMVPTFENIALKSTTARTMLPTFENIDSTPSSTRTMLPKIENVDSTSASTRTMLPKIENVGRSVVDTFKDDWERTNLLPKARCEKALAGRGIFYFLLVSNIIEDGISLQKEGF
jgi:hypothetical protein